jgi:hypothetical protein
MAFEMGSTNLVLELSIILMLIGWQFMAAEAIAAPIMVAILAVIFRLFLRPQLLQAAKDQAEKGIAGPPRWICRFPLKARYGGGPPQIGD